jgi:hypothetical protein
MGRRGRPAGVVYDPRRCGRCRKLKPLTDFVLAPSRPGGRTYECVDCLADRQLERGTNIRFRKIGLAAAQAEVERDQLIYLTKLRILRKLAKDNLWIKLLREGLQYGRP